MALASALIGAGLGGVTVGRTAATELTACLLCGRPRSGIGWLFVYGASGVCDQRARFATQTLAQDAFDRGDPQWAWAGW